MNCSNLGPPPARSQSHRRLEDTQGLCSSTYCYSHFSNAAKTVPDFSRLEIISFDRHHWPLIAIEFSSRITCLEWIVEFWLKGRLLQTLPSLSDSQTALDFFRSCSWNHTPFCGTFFHTVDMVACVVASSLCPLQRI
jgi:hypothetical protein